MEIRPMTPQDAPEAADVLHEAFADADERAGRTPAVPEPERVQRLVRGLQRFPETDPEGCWIAVDGQAVRGFTAAIRRDGFWGLALLFVRPEAQSAGVGRRLLERALESADGADVAMIQSSEDPRAIRRYALAGFDLHPAVQVSGTVERAALPAGLPVRAGSADDLDLVEAVDVPLRGTSRAPDAAFALEWDYRMVVSDRKGARGYAFHRDGSPVMLGAESEQAAAELLWACLAEAEQDAEVEGFGWTAAQRWAVQVALAARLTVQPGGPMFIRGLDRPPGPWLPSGWYF